METISKSNIIEMPELDDIKIDSPFDDQLGMVQELSLLTRFTNIDLSYYELQKSEQDEIKNDFISKIRNNYEKYYSIYEYFRGEYVIYICRGYHKNN